MPFLADVATTICNMAFADMKCWALWGALQEGVCVRGNRALSSTEKTKLCSILSSS